MQRLLTAGEDWEVKTLGEVCKITMGQSPSSSNYNYSKIGLPLIQGNADIKNRETIIRTYTSEITKRCKTDDIIMSVRAPVGEIARATFDACLGRGVCAITYENDFVYHYLIFIEPTWSKLSTGSTFDSVNSTVIRDLEVPIPPLSEQIHIATILSDMDGAIAGLEKQLEKYRAVKVGLMQELLSGRKRLV
jgi:type I restriction enzyme S subunit